MSRIKMNDRPIANNWDYYQCILELKMHVKEAIVEHSSSGMVNKKTAQNIDDLFSSFIALSNDYLRQQKSPASAATPTEPKAFQTESEILLNIVTQCGKRPQDGETPIHDET